jgi:hypothetical protein
VREEGREGRALGGRGAQAVSEGFGLICGMSRGVCRAQKRVMSIGGRIRVLPENVPQFFKF